MKKKYVAFALISSFFFLNNINAQTEISGNYADSILTVSKSPYKLTGHLQVQKDTLFIEPNVTIDMNGFVIAIGSSYASDRGVLISEDVNFNNSSDSSSKIGINNESKGIINNCSLNKTRITIDRSNITITNNTIENALLRDGEGAISVYDGAEAKPTVSNNVIKNCNGIAIQLGTGLYEENKIVNCSYAFGMSAGSNPELIRNEIENTEEIILLNSNSSSGYKGDFHIKNWGYDYRLTTSYFIKEGTFELGPSINVDLNGNFLGTIDTTTDNFSTFIANDINFFNTGSENSFLSIGRNTEFCSINNSNFDGVFILNMDAENISITKNSFANIDRNVLRIPGSAKDVSISENLFENINGDALDISLSHHIFGSKNDSIASPKAKVEKNVFKNVNGHAILVGNGIIANNSITDCKSSFKMILGTYPEFSNNQIVNSPSIINLYGDIFRGNFNLPKLEYSYKLERVLYKTGNFTIDSGTIIDFNQSEFNLGDGDDMNFNVDGVIFNNMGTILFRKNSGGQLTNCVFDGVSLSLEGNSNPFISNSTFKNISNYSVDNTGTSKIDAPNNYWGDPTGPYHETNNPAGQGFKVSDNVNFNPWATSPSSPSQSGDLTVFNINPQPSQGQQAEYVMQLEGLSIAADGSSATVFRYSGTDLENISLKIKENTNNEIELYGRFETGIVANGILEITYNHPEYFNLPNQKNREITIQVINDQTSDILTEYPIKIIRPPVLMVHGLWGNSDSFEDMEEILLDSGMYYISDPSKNKSYQLLKLIYINDIHNSENYGTFILFKELIKGNSRENNISLGKFDILAHSNGGLLSRQYIQSSNYKNDVNKFITFNTPHSGSQMANLLLDLGYVKIKENLEKNRFRCDGGLIEDLQVDSEFIMELNNKDTKYTPQEFRELYEDIGVHTISSTESTDNLIGEWDALIVTLLKFHIEETIDYFLENKVFKKPNHDMIVAQESQIADCEATTPYQNQFHVGSTKNPSFQAKTIELLNKNPNDSNYFSLNGLNPPTLTSQYNNSAKTQSQKQSNETITIASPIDGTEFSAGQNVTIEVNGSTGIKNIVSSMSNSIIPIQINATENSSSANFDFTIPNNAIGRLELVSAGFDDNGYAADDSTYIIVSTNAVLESIEIDQDLIYVPEGRKAIITILGHYNDGETRNITNIEDLIYTFEKDNASILESGLVSGLIEGEDVLTVAYMDKSTTVPITISNASEWLQITLDVDDEVLGQSILLYPNPVSGILSINSEKPLTKVEIYSILGKKVREINSNFNTIQTANLENGVYILRMHSEYGTIIRKFIKQ